MLRIVQVGVGSCCRWHGQLLSVRRGTADCGVSCSACACDLPGVPSPGSALPTFCPLQTADISAQNLGDEGFAYVVDALSFNDKCA